MKKKPSRKKRKEENAEEQKNLIPSAEEGASKRYGVFRFFEHEHGTSISFDLQDWHKPTFLKVLNKIPGLSIIESKQVHKSIAPAMVYEDLITTQGTLHIDREMDDFPGCTVASDNKQLMKQIADHLLAAGYEMRQIPSESTNAPSAEPFASITNNSETLCRFYEHEDGSISFDRDSFNESEFFKLINDIPGFEAAKKEMTFDAGSALGLSAPSEWPIFSDPEIRSSNGDFIKKIVEKLRASPYFTSYRETKIAKTSKNSAEAPSDLIPSNSVCPFFSWEHDYGATISFDLDLFNPADLFKELEKIPAFKILKKESLYSSFGPLESASKYFTTHDDFTLASTWEGMDTGHTLSSSNKEFIRLITKSLRVSSTFSELITKDVREDNPVETEEIPSPSAENNDAPENSHEQSVEIKNQPSKTKGEDGCGGTLLTLLFLFLTFYLLSIAVNFYSKRSINLDHAKMHRGKVIHSSISTKGGIRKSTGFNLEIEGLDHRFRFFNGNFSALKERIQPGVIITVYYEAYSWDIYQIEENGEVLYGKEIIEAGQWPGIIMSLIFAFFTSWVTWFLVKRI